MTDIIPRASSGRYMGLSNVATTASTIFAVATGGLTIDFINGIAGIGAGPRAAYLLGAAYYVIAGLTLMPVVEPRRSRGGSPPPSTPTAPSDPLPDAGAAA